MFKVAILQKRALNAQIEKNMESIIMAMNRKIMQIFFCCRHALLPGMICLCRMRKALQMMIKALQKYARKRKNIK